MNQSCYPRWAGIPTFALGLVVAVVMSSACAEVEVALVQKLTASDAQAGDEFGFSVWTDGHTIAAGALLEDSNGADAGAVYVFRFDGTQWQETQRVLAPDGAPGDQFGQVRVLDDLMAVGARGADSPLPGTGSVYLFREDAGDGQWSFFQQLLPAEAQIGDGCTVSDLVEGGLAVPCVLANVDGANNAGAVYVYRETDLGNFVQTARLTATEGGADDRFGGAVFDLGADSPSLVAGARGADQAGVDAGAARVLRQVRGDPANWFEVGLLLPEGVGAGDEYSARAAVRGDMLAVSAPGDDDVAQNAGAVYLFERDPQSPAGWRPIRTLRGDGAGAQHDVGRGLTWLTDDLLVVGAPGDDMMGTDAGAVYLFRRDECGDGAWGQAARYTAPDTAAGDLFGRQMRGAAGVLVVSAWAHDLPVENAGAVYVLSVSPPLDSDGDGVLDDRDNCSEVANADQRDSDGDGYGNICDADLDGSGRTTRDDLLTLLGRLGTGDADADLDGDGRVTLTDFGLARDQLFQRPGPSGPARCAGL